MRRSFLAPAVEPTGCRSTFAPGTCQRGPILSVSFVAVASFARVRPSTASVRMPDVGIGQTLGCGPKGVSDGISNLVFCHRSASIGYLNRTESRPVGRSALAGCGDAGQGAESVEQLLRSRYGSSTLADCVLLARCSYRRCAIRATPNNEGLWCRRHIPRRMIAHDCLCRLQLVTILTKSSVWLLHMDGRRLHMTESPCCVLARC